MYYSKITIHMCSTVKGKAYKQIYLSHGAKASQGYGHKSEPLKRLWCV